MTLIVVFAILFSTISFCISIYLWRKLYIHMVGYLTLVKNCIQMANMIEDLNLSEKDQKIVNNQLHEEYKNTIEILKKITAMLNSASQEKITKDEMN